MRYIFTILVFGISFFTYGQNQNNISILINSEPLDSLPKFVIKMNETEYFLDSIPDSINPNWIDKIEVLKSEVQKYIYGDGNGVVLIYPNKKYFDQISLLLKTYPNIQEQINEQTLDSIYIKALNSHLTYYYRVDKNSLSQTSRLKGLRIILDRIAFTNFSHQTSCLITPTNMVKL